MGFLELSSVKINDQGIPVDMHLIGELFGDRHVENHRYVYNVISKHKPIYEGTSGRIAFEVWEVTRDIASVILKEIAPEEQYTILAENERRWDEIFSDGKVYFIYGL